MDSTIFNPGTASEGVSALLYIVPILVTILLPKIVKLLNKWPLMDSIPTNILTTILAVGITFGLKYLLAPELTAAQVLALIGAMGLGTILVARVTPQSYSGRNWRDKLKP